MTNDEMAFALRAFNDEMMMLVLSNHRWRSRHHAMRSERHAAQAAS
jgi:hypothetical protein